MEWEDRKKFVQEFARKTKRYLDWLDNNHKKYRWFLLAALCMAGALQLMYAVQQLIIWYSSQGGTP